MESIVSRGFDIYKKFCLLGYNIIVSVQFGLFNFEFVVVVIIDKFFYNSYFIDKEKEWRGG